MTTRILRGDVRARLADLDDESVNCIVTSPPYWGLRSYLPADHPLKHLEIGSEPTVEAWVAVMVDVMRECRRVLRKDGVMFLNLGDSYAGSRCGPGEADREFDTSTLGGTRRSQAAAAEARATTSSRRRDDHEIPRSDLRMPGLKAKDLVGQPWRVAFALQADGWWLRQEVIWSKLNPMPESCRDRFTKSHEHVFIFARGQWVTRVVKFANLPAERFHLGRHIRVQPSDLGLGEVSVLLATALFDRAQCQHDFRLPPFYAEVWKQRFEGSASELVGRDPRKHFLASLAACLLAGHMTTKEFLCELQRVWLRLSDGQQFRERWRVAFGDAPCLHDNGDGTIRVHHSGKVSKVDLVQGVVSTDSPSSCSYYWNFEATQEEVNGGAHARGQRAHVGRREGPPGNPAEAPRVKDNLSFDAAMAVMPDTRNPRSVLTIDEDEYLQFLRWKAEQIVSPDVWTIPTHPFKGAHFATFPPELARRAIVAGCPPGGTVLDPFFGAGTVGLVADQLGMHAIGIELDDRSTALAQERIVGDSTLFAEVAA